MSERRNEVYSFGLFRLDAKEHVLLRGGKPIHLKPKIFELLVRLVENAGHMLTKEELMHLLWPDRFVDEHNLTVSIFHLRRALGATDEGYIQTMPKLGYRFTAKVRLVTTGSEDSSRQPGEILEGPIKSIAVLPLRSLGAVVDEYLRLGLSDAIITRLSTVQHLNVRPTSTILKYLHGEYEPVSIGRELKVSFILEGSIRKRGDHIRINFQLINVMDGAMLWAQKIDGDVGDILTFEDLVSEQMAKALFVTLSAVDRRRLSKPQTDDPDAYQAYLMGRFLVEKHNPVDTRKSVDCFNEAVRIDARYALAHVGLHRAYITLVGYGALPPKEGLLKAKQSALRAIELEPMLADAHACLGLSQMFSWDWLGAQQKYKLSIELNPNNPRTHQLYSAYLRNLGKRIESLVESGRAQELDPVSVNLRLTQAINLLHARQYDDALKEILKVTQMEVRLPSGHFVSGLIYEQLGSLEKAIIEFEEANSLIEYYNPEISANLARAYALSGNNKKARELLSILLERSRKQYVQPYHLALVYGALGEVERLFAFLEKSYREHDYELCLIKVDSRLDEFHNDSRYRNLLERVFSSRLEPGLT